MRRVLIFSGMMLVGRLALASESPLVGGDLPHLPTRAAERLINSCMECAIIANQLASDRSEKISENDLKEIARSESYTLRMAVANVSPKTMAAWIAWEREVEGRVLDVGVLKSTSTGWSAEEYQRHVSDARKYKDLRWLMGDVVGSNSGGTE